MAAVETARDAEARRGRKRRKQALIWRDRTIVQLLTEIRRARALTQDEKDIMDRAIAGSGPKRSIWRWSHHDDRILLALIARRAKTGRPAPYKVNREVLDIAESMGRTYMAVHRRIERLRKREKCSDAAKQAKG